MGYLRSCPSLSAAAFWVCVRRGALTSPSVLLKISKRMSLEEKTDVIEEWFKAGCSNVNHSSSINVSGNWSRSHQIQFTEENRENFPVVADQSSESPSERPPCSLLVNRTLRLIKSRGAFTMRLTGSQSRSFFVDIFSLPSPPHVTNLF